MVLLKIILLKLNEYFCTVKKIKIKDNAYCFIPKLLLKFLLEFLEIDLMFKYI